jgi:hypothetical protein
MAVERLADNSLAQNTRTAQSADPALDEL